jgi:hypothetical protein
VCGKWRHRHNYFWTYVTVRKRHFEFLRPLAHATHCTCILDDTPETDNNDGRQGSLSFKDTSIPSVSISFNNGTYFTKNKLNGLAQVRVYGVGTYCEQWQYCYEIIP